MKQLVASGLTVNNKEANAKIAEICKETEGNNPATIRLGCFYEVALLKKIAENTGKEGIDKYIIQIIEKLDTEGKYKATIFLRAENINCISKEIWNKKELIKTNKICLITCKKQIMKIIIVKKESSENNYHWRYTLNQENSTFTSQIDKTIEHEIPKNFRDIFAGAGGLTTGLEEAGLIATAAVDNNRQAILTYAENHPKTKVWAGDVNRFLEKKTNEKNLNNLEKIDVVVGCPPNQIWLLENKDSQKKQEENIKNINTLLKITNLYNPKIFMVELYIDMLKPKEEALVMMIITKLLKSGYQTRTDIINASYYGIPQRRISTIIYGIRNGLQMIGELKQTHKLKDNKEVIFNQELLKGYWRNSIREFTEKGDKKNEVTVLESLEDIPSELESKNYLNKSNNVCKNLRNKENNLQMHISLRHNRNSIERISKKPYGPGKNRNNGQSNNKTNRLEWQSTFKDIQSVPNWISQECIHPEENRILSIREYTRAQTFKDNYIFRGNKAEKYWLIGEAMPP